MDGIIEYRNNRKASKWKKSLVILENYSLSIGVSDGSILVDLSDLIAINCTANNSFFSIEISGKRLEYNVLFRFIDESEFHVWNELLQFYSKPNMPLSFLIVDAACTCCIYLYRVEFENDLFIHTCVEDELSSLFRNLMIIGPQILLDTHIACPFKPSLVVFCLARILYRMPDSIFTSKLLPLFINDPSESNISSLINRLPIGQCTILSYFSRWVSVLLDAGYDSSQLNKILGKGLVSYKDRNAYVGLDGVIQVIGCKSSMFFPDSPVKSNDKPGSPVKSNDKPGSPVKSNDKPGSPVKSNDKPVIRKRRPSISLDDISSFTPSVTPVQSPTRISPPRSFDFDNASLKLKEDLLQGQLENLHHNIKIVFASPDTKHSEKSKLVDLFSNQASNNGDYDQLGALRILETQRTVIFKTSNGTSAGNLFIECWDCNCDLSYESCWPAILQASHALVLIFDGSSKAQLQGTVELARHFLKLAKLTPKECILVNFSNIDSATVSKRLDKSLRSFTLVSTEYTENLFIEIDAFIGKVYSIIAEKDLATQYDFDS